MKETDSISVLICVHSSDHEHDMLLQRSLESLARQTYDNFETVIVMDECRNETRGIVDSYSDVLDLKIFERPRKQGLAIAKNFGIQRCSGDWIAYLDADDQWLDCKLAVQRQWLMDHAEISLCGTNAWDLLDGIMVPNCFSVLDYVTHDQILQRLGQENIMCHGSMMIRAKVLEALGSYNTDKKHLGREDWELWIRAARDGFVFGKVPERLYVYSLGTSVPR